MPKEEMNISQYAGKKIISPAEQERIDNPDPGPSRDIDTIKAAEEEIKKLTGKSIGELTEAEFYRLPVKLTAQNLSCSTELSVEMKDPSMACRWFNAKSKHGHMVQHALMRGYTACTKDDVAACHATATDDHGALMMGDLVLLKISKLRQLSTYKNNAETAKYRVSQQSAKPFGATVPGIDNSSVSGVRPYQLSSEATAVDAVEARSLVFNR